MDASTVCQRQVLGVSARPEKVDEFGIPEAHQLPFPETVGGRFPVCSVIGVSVALELGMEPFEVLLAGAHAMDAHFRASVPGWEPASASGPGGRLECPV